jgi:hypothetical protein
VPSQLPLLIENREFRQTEELGLPRWEAGFWSIPGLYETLRWNPQMEERFRRGLIEAHRQRMESGWQVLYPGRARGILPSGAELMGLLESGWNQLGQPALMKARWTLHTTTDSAMQDYGTEPRFLMWLEPWTDPAPDHACLDPGVVLWDSPVIRETGDGRWMTKRTGWPLSAETKLIGESNDAQWWEKLALLKSLDPRGHIDASGSGLVEWNQDGQVCETTWGSLAAVRLPQAEAAEAVGLDEGAEESGSAGLTRWKISDESHGSVRSTLTAKAAGAAGILWYPPVNIPRLPSVTLGRLGGFLRAQGWQEKVVPFDLSELTDPDKSWHLVVVSSLRGVVPVSSWWTIPLSIEEQNALSCTSRWSRYRFPTDTSSLTPDSTQQAFDGWLKDIRAILSQGCTWDTHIQTR